MQRRSLFLIFCLLAAIATGFAASTPSEASYVRPVPAATPTAKADNSVCPDPAKPCHHKERHFDEWELSFKLPSKFVRNKGYKSKPFYALILKSYETAEDCDGGEYIKSVEAERIQLQKEQPTRKVFVSYECPNMGAIDYDFAGKFDAKRERVIVSNYMAIYAGETKAQADALLKELKAKFPDAVVKQMTAVYEDIDQ